MIGSLIEGRTAALTPTKVYDTYWRFACERQAIFFRRLAGHPRPWTDDQILQSYKFTNVYRASDRVSQYLIKNVIYTGSQDPKEVFFRVILFKIFNRIETWELLERAEGAISYEYYSFEKYDRVLTEALSKELPIFSAAYIMPSGPTKPGATKKHRHYLHLLEHMMADEVPARIQDMKSMQAVFKLLKSYPGIGDFLAYQYAIDLNYSELTNFSEMEYVVPGPGACEGIRKCFRDSGNMDASDIIRLVCECQHEEFSRLSLTFHPLGGRPLQLIDCQNLFCEVAKYARVAHPDVKDSSGRVRIKQKYKPGKESLEYWYPPKWGISLL